MITRVVNWLFAAFLLSVGLYLTIRGATLISLGGSWYYTLAGLGLLGVVALLIMRNGFAGTLYAIIVAATVIWSIPEAGLDLLALLPRLMAWVVVGQKLQDLRGRGPLLERPPDQRAVGDRPDVH